MKKLETTEVIVSDHSLERGTQRSYTMGFLLSVYLTLTSFALVYYHLFSKWPVIFAVAGLVVLQFIVQLTYFLHLGKEAKPRWKLIVFYFMLLVVVIVVFGSLWIMSNLNYHHHHHLNIQQQEKYLDSQDGL